MTISTTKPEQYIKMPNAQPQSCQLEVYRDGQFEKRVTCRRGLSLEALALRHQLDLEFSCRNADCGVCVIKVLSDPELLGQKTEREIDFLQAMRADPKERLACQCRLWGDSKINIEDFGPS